MANIFKIMAKPWTAQIDALGLGKVFSPPQRDQSAMDQAMAMIQQQYGNINAYFEQANKDLETQFGAMRGRTMTDAINALAGSGVYESPVSEYQLNRTRQGLAETYATAKSSLAGLKMSALSGIDQQKIGYYQNIANQQYQDALVRYQNRMQLIGAGASLLGALI